MQVEFDFSTVGLKAKFTNLSEDLSSKVLYSWDFGDGTFSHELDPIHFYKAIGKYRVTLSARSREDNEDLGSISQMVLVSDFIKTHLSNTIYKLIDTYIPANVFGRVSMSTKRHFIEKWQLYIQPLVNHLIPIEEYNNELYYEALENQLIMELAAYDFMMNQVNLTFQAISQSVKDNNEVACTSPTGETVLGINGGSSSSTSSSSVTDSSGGKVKKITAGPTEVEYFDSSASDSDAAANALKAMQPGGVIDIIKQNICMLAERLGIYLPICNRPPSTKVVPKIVNRRRPGFLGGPDPLEVLE